MKLFVFDIEISASDTAYVIADDADQAKTILEDRYNFEKYCIDLETDFGRPRHIESLEKVYKNDLKEVVFSDNDDLDEALNIQQFFERHDLNQKNDAEIRAELELAGQTNWVTGKNLNG